MKKIIMDLILPFIFAVGVIFMNILALALLILISQKIWEIYFCGVIAWILITIINQYFFKN